MEYEELLDKAISELPDTITKTERFQVDKVKGHLEGNKTVLVNFFKIAKSLGRESDHLFKFLLREFATPGKIHGDRVILGSKIPASQFNRKIKQYVNEFIICPECNSPDTKMIKEKDVTRMKCLACGARHFVKTI